MTKRRKTRADWHEVIMDGLQYRNINAKDRGFLERLSGLPEWQEFSDKQIAWLRDIENRIYAIG